MSATHEAPAPAYIGLVVGEKKAGLFDNFVLAAAGDPRYVTVSGLPQGWSVELKDANGALIASALADSSGTARLSVVAKPVIANAKITVKNERGDIVVERVFSEVVGGDEYYYGL